MSSELVWRPTTNDHSHYGRRYIFAFWSVWLKLKMIDCTLISHSMFEACADATIAIQVQLLLFFLRSLFGWGQFVEIICMWIAHDELQNEFSFVLCSLQHWFQNDALNVRQKELVWGERIFAVIRVDESPTIDRSCRVVHLLSLNAETFVFYGSNDAFTISLKELKPIRRKTVFVSVCVFYFFVKPKQICTWSNYNRLRLKGTFQKPNRFSVSRSFRSSVHELCVILSLCRSF